MNKEEAERALSEAYKRISNGNINEALKYLKISQRLSPSLHKQQLINRYSNTSTSTSSPSSTSSSPSTSTSSSFSTSSSSNSTSNSQINNNNDILIIIKNQLNLIIEKILQFEQKYIQPSMRNFIRGMFFIIIILIIVKYVFKQKIGYGLLPGDISYSSSNVYFSFPIVSSLLISFLFNGLGRIFRS